MVKTVEFMGKTGRFEVRYKDKMEYVPVEEAKMRRALSGNYKDIEWTIALMFNGMEAQTAFAVYRYVVTIDSGKTWNQQGTCGGLA